jgi:predicted DNA-binding transcriptional regulator AlpA
MEYFERLIGSTRRECTDHLIVFSEEHLRRILAKYASYYNEMRVHTSLAKDAPFTRPIERSGDIVAYPILGGLHHRYVRIWFSESDRAVDTGDTRRRHKAAVRRRNSPVRSVTGIAGLSEFLTAADLCEQYHRSRMRITLHIKQHHFPRPIKFGGHVGYVRWPTIVERWANEWMTAPLGNELVRSARPHQARTMPCADNPRRAWRK